MSTTTTTTTSTSLATTFPKTISAVPPDTNRRGYYQKQGVIHTTNLLSPSKVSTISRAFTSQVELDNTIGHDDNVPSSDPSSSTRASYTRTATHP
jgi:hypothetical protein